jgi:dodecin
MRVISNELPMKGDLMPHTMEKGLHVAKVVEIMAESTKSFEDAIAMGVDRATKTLKNVQGAWVKEQQVVVRDGKIAVFRVNLKVTFILME